MDGFDKVKQNQIKTMFFLLKILALFFCATPIFQYFFKNSNTTESYYELDITAFLIFLCIVLVILFLWLIMDYDRQRLKFVLYIEILVFYLICIASICLSGSYESYYKFIFIFMIVSYTMEFGINTGISIATVSSVTLLCMDLFLYKGIDVNPYFQSDLALSAMFIVVAWILGFYVKMERQHIKELKEYANIDGLTEIYNHRHFYEVFSVECEKSKENNIPISLVMFDIDYFKTYNDMYGHQQGDSILKTIATLLKNNTKKTNFVFRYGGEEFCIILPETNQKEAIKIADTLRQIIYNFEFEGMENMPSGHITVSVGISELYGANDKYQDVIARADDALYRAKFFRKNRVEIYSSIFDDADHINRENPNLDDDRKSIKSLISIINSRDRYTYNHIERVVYYCQVFADYLRLINEDKRKLIYGAYLHDLGKINISKEILISSKPLTEPEWDEVKKHPGDSADIIRQMGGMENIIPVVLQHHEKYDGTGYPNQLKGEKIHYLARILTVADSFDAMTNKRPYQEKRTFEEAFEEIRRNKGIHFDPVLAEQFIKAIENMK